MGKDVNIRLPPTGANIRDDACGAMVGLLDVSVSRPNRRGGVQATARANPSRPSAKKQFLMLFVGDRTVNQHR